MYPWDHGVCVLYKILICLPSVVHKVKSTCIWVGKTRPTSLDLGRPKSAPTWSPSHRALPEPASWQGLVQGWTTTAGHLHQQLPHVWPSQGMGRRAQDCLFTSTRLCICSEVWHMGQKSLCTKTTTSLSPQQLWHIPINSSSTRVPPKNPNNCLLQNP